MSKPTHVARYYADDKDVFDLLSQNAVSLPKLRTFLRTRGILLSPALSKEAICRYLQTSPLSWPQLEALLALIEKPDREDKFATCRIDSDKLDIQAASLAASAVQQERGSRHGEIYNIQVSNDGALEVAVNYTEPNFSKTRCLQHLDKTLMIRLEREGGQFKVRHHENLRALEILSALEKKLSPALETPPPRHEIKVSGLSSVQRSRFFVEMARGINGFELRDERGLQVDRPWGGDSTEEDEEGAESVGASKPTGSAQTQRDAREQIQGLVRRALLHGTSLLMSPQYQEYSKTGYSLSKLIWTVEPKSGDGPMIEFAAEFGDGERGMGFRYAVLGQFERQDDGSYAKTRRAVASGDRKTLLALLESSAYAALDKVKEIDASPKVPEGETTQ